VIYTILQYTITMKYNVRIKKIIGQLEALARLSDERGAACDEVLQQVSAVQGAVLSLKKQIIDDSLENCLESRHAHREAKQLLTTIRRYI
ncbi:MAG TPA: metal-sensitive transcriptional regulator, partial [Candidatus Saccharibacteria bacterium]|nr:metal-sensitive transcriptional regulator [Candidatus Saccharibacteria bacterium]